VNLDDPKGLTVPSELVATAVLLF